MQNLPLELKKEYGFLMRNHPDIEGLEHPFINLSDAFRAYFVLVHYFTDSSTDELKEQMMVGIRSIDLLASALGRQNISFMGKQKYTDPLDICATLFFGIVKNHSFNDGNKRTGLLLLLYQLRLYGYSPTAPKSQFETLVLRVADGTVPEYYQEQYREFQNADDPVIHTLSYLLKHMTVKRDSSCHTAPTMRAFCSVLEAYGVKYEVENGRVRFTYGSSGKCDVCPPAEQTYRIPFHGWTRTVDDKTAADTLEALGICEQALEVRSLFDGSEPMYELVDAFKEPLRRLKDE